MSRFSKPCVVFLLMLTASAASATAKQTAPSPPPGQDCATIKQDIEELQQELADLSAEMQRETELLDQLNKDVAQTQADLNVATAHANAGITNETIRGQLLDTLAKLLGYRKQVRQQLEDDASLIQAIKDEIADLLSKLANCAPPSTTAPSTENPSPQPPPPSNSAPSSPQTSPSQPPSQTPAPAKQPTDQDCETIKKDIEELQQELADLSAEMQRETELLDQLNKDVAQTQADLNVATTHANAGITNETIRGQLLDTLAKLLSYRKQVRQQLEDDASLIQAIKDEITDLLNKLGNCAPPNTSQPQQQETQPQNATPPTPPPNPPAPPATNKSVSMSGFTPTFQIRGFGGPSFINGNTPPTAGFDGAVLFPLGNRILIGPTGGFQWVNSSIVQTIGSQQPGSTFINTTAGFKQGNFGGVIDFPFRPIDIGILGGATVVNWTITQQSGFCGLGNATSPAGCTVTSTTTTHNTGVGSFVGGYVSHTIFPHVGVFVGYDYHLLKNTTAAGTSSTSSSSNTVFDVHDNSVTAGLMLSFGRHSSK